MKAFKCDRCGNYFGKREHEKYHIYTDSNSALRSTLDLCPECNNKLTLFMASTNQEEKNKEETE